MATLGKLLQAVADPGAEVTLIDIHAACCLNLRISEHYRLRLRALWPGGSGHASLGTTNVSLNLDNSMPVWITAVIIDFRQTAWDILASQDTLDSLGVHLMMPAMVRRIRGTEKIPDHPGKVLDSPHRALESVYESFPDMAPVHDLSEPFPTEVSTTTTTTVKEPMVSHPMRVCIGLLSGFFIPSHDTDFQKWDSLYPAVLVESVRACSTHQCVTVAEAELLLEELASGKAALREYVGGCPPPAAYAPICPPMRPDAQPIYIVQHTLSQAAKDALELVVTNRLKYGIDGPSTAFAQMPIFTKSKPGMSEKRVLFNDSANNSLNMISIGMQLPTPMERTLFLCDCILLSSIDMASFFTQLRLANDVANFHTYDGGTAGKVRTMRMVQGNSESPAIAQAFLTHVLAAVPELHGKLLIYIDNVYLKSTTGDWAEHIAC